jgi:hypothetical protein
MFLYIEKTQYNTMRYLKDFDYIIENMSQARKILKENDISKDNKDFKKILDKTNRDGYTGFITKLVFEMGMDTDSALRLYDDLKENNIDIGSRDIKKILDNNVSNNIKIKNIIDIVRKSKNKVNDFELIFKSHGFDVYKINNYEGIMYTGSPAWCLKTKSYFDQYTKTKKGTQFVLIDSRLVKDSGEFNITVPKTWNGDRYSKPGYESLRYGITVYPSGRMDVFDDNNTQTLINSTNGEIESNRPITPFLKETLKKLYEYYMKEIKPNMKEIGVKPGSDYESFKDVVGNALEMSSSESFNAMVESYRDIDEYYNEFIHYLKEGLGVENKSDVFGVMNQHINEILSDDYFTSNCALLDILLNEFVSRSGEFPQLEEFPGITKREIPLGGYFIDEQPGAEIIIKYYYGFQYDKYGKAAIQQGFGTVENFYKHLAENFNEVLEDGYGNFDWDNDVIDDSKLNKEFYKLIPYKDGYKIITSFDEMKKYDIVKNIEGFNKFKEKLIPWFKGMESKNGKLEIPICSFVEEPAGTGQLSFNQ